MCVGYGRCQLGWAFLLTAFSPPGPRNGSWRQRWWLSGLCTSAAAGPALSRLPPSLAFHGRIPGLCIDLRFGGFCNIASFCGFPFLPLRLTARHGCAQLQGSAPAAGGRQLLMSRQNSAKLISLTRLVSALPCLCFPNNAPGYMLSLRRLIFKCF